MSKEAIGPEIAAPIDHVALTRLSEALRDVRDDRLAAPVAATTSP